MVRVGSSTSPKHTTPEGWIGASRAGHPQPSLQRRTNFPASQKNSMSKIPWQRIYRRNWWNLEAWEFGRMIIWTNLEEFSMKDHRTLVRSYIEKGDKRNAPNSHTNWIPVPSWYFLSLESSLFGSKKPYDKKLDSCVQHRWPQHERLCWCHSGWPLVLPRNWHSRPPVVECGNQHGRLENPPSSIGKHIHSIRVHFPASHVSLPEGILYIATISYIQSIYMVYINRMIPR